MNNNSTILIVDDEAVGRDTLEMLLTGQGYNLAFASNGAETLAKAAELVPDLILLDVMMPDMDGFEVCRRIREDSLLADVPVIMVTALDDRDCLLEGIEVGADDFVTKPFDRVELRTRVKTITRLNRFRRLLAERSKFEWVVEHAEDGYLIIDGNGEIGYANQQARLYLNLPENQNGTDPKSFQEVVQERYRCEPQEAWSQESWTEQNAAGEASSRYLVQPESATANEFWLQVDMLRVDQSSSGDINWLVRLGDVTAQMAVHRDRWQFHAMVTHKLRTPLIPMLTNLELLALRAPQLSSSEVVQFSEWALEGMKRLRNEVDDILQYLNSASLSQAEREGNFELSQLQPIVAEICAELDVEFRVSCQEELSNDHLTLNISAQAIELILREIIGNARKFHPKQAPTIEVVISRPNPDQVSLKFVDDGVVLSPEQLAQAWIPYYQGEKFFTGEASGMGLGLPMVASVVWGVGGTCRMRNREERPGVVVDLTLTLKKSETSSVVEEPEGDLGAVQPMNGGRSNDNS